MTDLVAKRVAVRNTWNAMAVTRLQGQNEAADDAEDIGPRRRFFGNVSGVAQQRVRNSPSRSCDGSGSIGTERRRRDGSGVGVQFKVCGGVSQSIRIGDLPPTG